MSSVTVQLVVALAIVGDNTAAAILPQQCVVSQSLTMHPPSNNYHCKPERLNK